MKPEAVSPEMECLLLLQLDECKTCKLQGKGLATAFEPVGSTGIPRRPWALIGYDLITMMETKRGNRYALTIVDYFSMFAVAWPLKTKDADEVARSLLQTYALLAAPQYVLTDNGKD